MVASGKVCDPRGPIRETDNIKYQRQPRAMIVKLPYLMNVRGIGNNINLSRSLSLAFHVSIQPPPFQASNNYWPSWPSTDLSSWHSVRRVSCCTVNHRVPTNLSPLAPLFANWEAPWELSRLDTLVPLRHRTPRSHEGNLHLSWPTLWARLSQRTHPSLWQTRTRSPGGGFPESVTSVPFIQNLEPKPH